MDSAVAGSAGRARPVANTSAPIFMTSPCFSKRRMRGRLRRAKAVNLRLRRGSCVAKLSWLRVYLSFLSLSCSLRLAPVAQGNDVDGLDGGRKRHGEIDVSAWDVEVEAVGDQGSADQEQERQRQHLRGRMPLDEGRHRLRR